MKQVSNENFGLLIAYIVPGLTALWGASYLSATIRSWMSGPAIHGPTIGGFLFATIAAVGTGLVVSTVRWLAGNLANLLARFDELIVEPLVISLSMIVFEKSSDCPTQ